jgi:hypothetical protein
MCGIKVEAITSLTDFELVDVVDVVEGSRIEFRSPSLAPVSALVQASWIATTSVHLSNFSGLTRCGPMPPFPKCGTR